MTSEAKRSALIIAVSEYSNLDNLDICKNDGDAIYRLFKSIGYEIPDYRKIVGRVEYSTVHDAIIEFFTDETVHTNDTLVFYFSGYGLPAKKADEYYLSSSEINPKVPRLRGFPFDELMKTMQESNSKSIVTILNCFHYDTVIASSGNIINAAALGQKIIENKSAMIGTGRCILASCDPWHEAYKFRVTNSPFVSFFMAIDDNCGRFR